MNRPTTLIMTATITPPSGCPDLVRKEPSLRLMDYELALKYYLQVSSSYINKIIFAENSDSDLFSLNAICSYFPHDKEVEFISYSGGNSYPPEFGKGFGEMMLLNYVLDNSSIIENSDCIWKATGRLILCNIEKLISSAPSDYDVYCDLHSEFKCLKFDRFFDPRFYSFSFDGYNKYLKLDAENLKYAHIEHLYYDLLVNELPNSKIVPRFKKQPLIKGFAAAENSNYYTNKKIIQRYFQQLFRVISPGFWL